MALVAHQTLRSVFRVVGWIGGALLLVLVLAVALLHTPPAKKYAERQLSVILRRQGIDFETNGLSYNLLDLTVSLRSVRVRSPQTPSLPAVLVADRVEVDFSLRKLLQGQVSIEEARVDAPVLHVVVDSEGHDNIPRSSQSSSGSATELFVDHLSVNGGSVEYEDRRQHLDVRIPLNRIEVHGNPVTGNHDITLITREGGLAAVDQHRLDLGLIEAKALLKNDSLDVQKLSIQAAESEFSVSGQVNTFKDPRFDLSGNSKLSLSALRQFGGVAQPAAGTVEVAWTVSGPLAKLKATARLDGKDLTLDRFRGVTLQAEVAYVAEKARVQLQSFNVRSPLGSAKGNGEVALTPAAGASRANVAIRGIDLATAMALFGQEVRIASRADGEVEANWPGLAFDQAAANATLRLTPTRTEASANLVPLTAQMNVSTKGRRTVIGISQLRALDASAAGTVTLADRRLLGGTLQMTAGDVGPVVRQVEAFLGKPAGTLLGTPVTGGANVQASLSGTVAQPGAKLTVDAPVLQAGTLRGVSLHADANYDPARVQLDRLRIGWNNQTVSASGSIGLKGTERELQLQADATDVSIAQVLAGLNRGDLPVSGTASLHAQATGTVENPVAQVQLSAANVVAYEEALGTVAARGGVTSHTARLDELRLDKPQDGGNGTLNASGTYDFDSRAYTLIANGNDLDVTRLVLPDGSAVRVQGAAIEARGQGNVADPNLTARVSAKAARYRDQDFGAVDASANVANRQADLRLNAPKYGLAGTAKLGTDAPYAGTFSVRAENTRLETLPLPPDVAVTGTVTATLNGTGSIEDYTQGQASIEVQAANVQWQGQPIQIDEPLKASYANEELKIDQATIKARGSQVALSGTIPLTDRAGVGAIRVSANLDLPTLAAYLPKPQEITATGTATLQGEIRGTLKSIDPRLTIALNNGGFASSQWKYPITNATLNGEVEDGALELRSAAAQFGPASITAIGAVPLGLLPDLPVTLPRRQGAAQFTADLKTLDLGALGLLPDAVSGTMSAHLEATALRPELNALSAILTLPQFHLSLANYALDQKAPSRIMVQNSVATLDQFELVGPLTDLTLAGSVGLTGDYALNLKLNGNSDASLASAFSDKVRASGAVTIQAAVTGTAKEPSARGFVELANAQVAMSNPFVAAEGLNARLELNGQQVDLTRLQGSLNGGTLSGSGRLGYQNGLLANTDLNIKAEGSYFNLPDGLKTVSTTNLNLRSSGRGAVLSGQVRIDEGGFTDDLNLDRGILAALTAPTALDLTETRDPLLDSIRFNVSVVTANPIVVEDNLAKVEISTDLRVVGTAYEPSLSGRLEVAENGEIRLQERKYQVERGVITFNNERRIEPDLDVIATTSAGGFDIRLQVQGRIGKTTTTITSDPALPEADILALLITGKRQDQLQGQEVNVARDQMLSYLAGRVGSTLGRGIQRATGLSTVRIEPNLIAAETNPTARLTVGQDITRNLELIYSMDLVNSSDQIYVANYALTKRFTTRGVRQSDGSFRFDFRHSLRFGGLPEPRRGTKVAQARIGMVDITGNPGFTNQQVLEKFKLKAGDHYDFFKSRSGVNRVEGLYKGESFLEAKIQLRRDQQTDKVDLTLNAERGPKVNLVYEGASLPGGLRDKIRYLWTAGVFDAQRVEDAKAAITEWLIDDNRLQPQILYTVTSVDAETKRVVFDIQQGPRFHDVEWVFDGAKGESQDSLRNVIRQQKLQTEVYSKPGRVTELLKRYYQEIGYLDATLSAPRYELDAASGTGKVVFPVAEGPLYRVGTVHYNGNHAISAERLNEQVPFPNSEAFRPVLRANAEERLKSAYWRAGYNDVDAKFITQRQTAEGIVNIQFDIDEGPRSVIREVVIEGNDKTSERFIRSQLALEPGQTLSLDRVGNARRRLYSTGAYSLVDVINEPIEKEAVPPTDNPPQTPPARTALGEVIDKPIRLRVKVQEIQPYELLYGGFYDTEHGPGGIVDISNHNSLGSARVLGFRGRYDSQLHEARVYFSQPLLRRFPVKTIITPYLRQERNPATSDTDAFNVNRIGASFQQEFRLRRNLILNYGYRIEKSRTYDPAADGLFDIPLRIASLTNTLSRETRDEILDATRGSFMSHAAQYSVKSIGSELSFIKYMGQYFHYFPLQKPKIELFTNEVKRPRLVYATGIRVGLAKGFGGQEVPLSERFLAGGGTSIRGFEQNTVGPLAGRQSLGGQGMLILNNELRAPLFRMFDGVGFVDIGNVFANVTDFRFGGLRRTAGVGLRARTPWFLLRLDYGMKLDRKEGEALGRIYFSIGQAF